jgi:hypothetical protein
MPRLAILSLVWVNAFAQPRPLSNISVPHPAHEISILRATLQDLKPAHGGPSYFPAHRSPFRGKSEIVEVTLYGQESVATVRFELIDESARVLQAVPALRTGEGADADGYVLKLDVPDLPFRLRVRGTDLAGRPFTHTFRQLFTPMEGTPAAPIPAELDSQFHTGDLHLTRTAISNATYEPLLSATGNPLGLRIRFTVRFTAPTTLDFVPHVFPVFSEYRWRGEITMQSATIPTPTRYAADTDYQLTYDLIPSYVRPNRDGSYCIQSPARLAIFEEILASRTPVKYRVDISALDFLSETEPLDLQRTWLESFRREGATRCAQ